MARRTRRALLGAAALPVAAGATFVAQVQAARKGPDIRDREPLVHDGHLDGPGRPLRMLWLGDSSAAGLGATSADTAMPRRVAVALDRPVDLASVAVSGARVQDVLRDQVAAVAALDPDLVLLSIGTNDVLHGARASELWTDLERLLAAVPGGTRLAVLGLPDLAASPRFSAQPLRAVLEWRTRVLGEVVRLQAVQAGALYVDIAAATGPAFRRDPHRAFAEDLFHPGDEGYRIWADAVVEALRPALAAIDGGAVGHR